MAKPTIRVPLWADTGTKTDPGGTKEDAGWAVSERPPAEWINWMNNARDQHLTYYDTATLPIVAAGLVTDSDTLVWSFNTTGVVAVGTGPPLNTIVIQIAETFAGDNCMPIVQMLGGSGAGYHYATSASISANEYIYARFGSTLGTGANDIDPTGTDFDFYYALVGPIT